MNKLCCVINPDMKCTACNSSWCKACVSTLEYLKHWGPEGSRGGDPIVCQTTLKRLKWNGIHSNPVVWCPVNE